MKHTMIVFLLFAGLTGCETYQNTDEPAYVREMREKRIASESARAERDRASDEKYEAAKRGPKRLAVVDHLLWHDSIGTPMATISLYNNAGKDIDALEISFMCFDNFGRPVRKYGRGPHAFNGISQETVKANSKGAAIWSLIGYDTVTKIKNIKIGKVHYSQ